MRKGSLKIMTEGLVKTIKFEEVKTKKLQTNKNNPPTCLFNKVLSEYSFLVLGCEEHMKDGLQAFSEILTNIICQSDKHYNRGMRKVLE